MTQLYDEGIASAIIRAFDARAEMLVQILHGFMDKFGCVSDDAMRQIAKELNLSRADVYGVVSYYHDFRTAPSGRRIVKICQSEACQAMGCRELTQHAQTTLGLELQQSNAEHTLLPVYCLGNCAVAPSVMIDNVTYGRVSSERLDQLLATETRG